MNLPVEEVVHNSAPRSEAEMGILDHLAELRTRLIRCFIAVGVGTIAAYSFSERIFGFLQQPFVNAFPNHSLIGTGPAEAFTLEITVSIFTGAILVLPYLFYQVWLFVSPGLYDTERKLVLPFVFFTSLLFLLGVAFCFYVVLPFSFAFFKERYDALQLAPQIKMSEHLSLTVKALIGFGICFEMPVLAYFLGRIGVIDHHTLNNLGRYAIVLIFIVAGVLTPPDVISQLLMVAPLLLLYGISIIVVKYTALSVTSKDSPTGNIRSTDSDDHKNS